MATDYRKLCIELFQTDDEEKLRKIAEEIQKKNTRNAGRKKKLSETEVTEIKKQLADGVSPERLAAAYGTSRQIVTKSINRACDRQYPLQILYMYGNKICTLIHVDFINEKLEVENRTDDILHRAFGVKENPNWQDFRDFLADRCFPKTRSGAKQILEDLKIDSYDPLQIVEKTEGRVAEDHMHLKFRYYKGGIGHEGI